LHSVAQSSSLSRLVGGLVGDRLVGGIVGDRLVGGLVGDRLVDDLVGDRLVGGIVGGIVEDCLWFCLWFRRRSRRGELVMVCRLTVFASQQYCIRRLAIELTNSTFLHTVIGGRASPIKRQQTEDSTLPSTDALESRETYYFQKL
jgi:hypothetical protein